MTQTLSLSELLRRPARVKKLTAAGHDVCVTDKGKPLWKLTPLPEKLPDDESEKEKEALRIATFEAIEAELLAEPRSCAPSFFDVLMENRR